MFMISNKVDIDPMEKKEKLESIEEEFKSIEKDESMTAREKESYMYGYLKGVMF